MALGARRAYVIWLVLRESLALVSAGVLIGTFGALVILGVVGKSLFGLKPLDGPTFAGAALVLGLTALMATLIPAQRAAKIEPAQALRYE